MHYLHEVDLPLILFREDRDESVLLLYNVLHKTFAIANKFDEVMPRSQESKIYGLIGFDLGVMMQSATRILDKHLNF